MVGAAWEVSVEGGNYEPLKERRRPSPSEAALGMRKIRNTRAAFVAVIVIWGSALAGYAMVCGSSAEGAKNVKVGAGF